MRFVKYTLNCKLMDKAVLPAYKGSLFRELFGAHFKHQCCRQRKKRCDLCSEKLRCDYASFFEIPREVVTAQGLPQTTPPRPFIIEPPLTREVEFPSGSPLDFDLILMGPAVDAADNFIRALASIGHNGIGPGRAVYDVKTVTVAGEVVYQGLRRRPECPVVPQEMTLPALPAPASGDSRLTITLETPLRLKATETAQPDLPFHTLVRMMLRRVSVLFACYGAQEPDWDYKALIDGAREVTVAHNDLQWFDWKTHASRQDKSLLTGAVSGAVTYGGPIDPYRPLLALCQDLHVGRQTRFGLGRFSCGF